MLKGFRDFILRGNVIDLAVAVIIGAAFTSIVTSLVTDIINPLIAAIVSLHGGVIKYGNFLNSAIAFALIAAVVYFFIVLPVNTLLLRLRGPAPSSTKPCPQCFGDIPLAATRCKFCTQSLLKEV